MTQEQLLTCTEVAAIFSVSRSAVTRWAKTGKLPYSRTPVAGELRFRRADVDRLLTVSGAGVSW